MISLNPQAAQLTNLRPSSELGVFAPVGATTKIAQLVGAHAIGSSSTANYLVRDGQLIVTDHNGMIVSQNDLLVDAPTAALPMPDGRVLAVTPTACHIIQPDHSLCEHCDDYPAVGMTAAEGSVLLARTPKRVLSQVYDSATPTPADAAHLGDDITLAYRQLTDTATALGVAFQPFIAGYRLLDKHGRTLFVSPPLLISPKGFQCTESVLVASVDRQTVPSYSLTAQSYRLQLALPEAESEATTLEVLAMPQLHPFDAKAVPDISLNVTGGSFLRVAIPGRGLAAGGAMSVRRDVAQYPASARVIATVHHPFASARTVKVAIPPLGDAPKSAAVDTCNQFLPPHRFGAGCAASSSSATLFAGLKLTRYRGYAPAVFSANSISTPYRATSTVTFADGRRCTRVDQCSSGLPTLLSPLISYPSPDAVEHELCITAAGKNYMAKTTLAPDPSGRWAIGIAADLKPTAIPTATTLPLREASELCDSHPHTLGAAMPGSPRRLLALGSLPGDRAVAILPRIATDASWEFGRARFVVAGEKALYSVAVDRDSKALSVKALTDMGISRRDAIAFGPLDAIYFVSGRRLWRLNTRGVSLFHHEAYEAVAFNRRRNELWALRSDGTARIFCLDRGDYSYVRTLDVPKQFCTLGNQLCGTTDDSFALLDSEGRWGTVPIKAEEIIVAPKKKRSAPRQFSICASGESVTGTLTLKGCNAFGESAFPIVSFSIHGAMRGLTNFRILTRPTQAFKITLTADVDYTFRL